MKIFLSSLLRFLVTNYVGIRGWYWDLTKNLNGTKFIRVFTNKSFRFLRYGLIPKRLYEQSPLVRYNRGFEHMTLSFIQKFVKNNSVVLDIGANVGLHSLFAASCFESNGHGKIYAFEPSKKTFAALIKNIQNNKFDNVITAANVALSDIAGQLVLSTPGEYRDLGENSDAYKSLQDVNDESPLSEIVDVVTLDEWAESSCLERVDLIKIDIEGAELKCLTGGVGVLRRFRPVVIFECSEAYSWRFGYTVSNVIQFMTDQKFAILQYEESQWIAIPVEKINAMMSVLTTLLPWMHHEENFKGVMEVTNAVES